LGVSGSDSSILFRDAVDAEPAFLDTVAERADYGRPLAVQSMEYCAGIFCRHIRGGSLLEIGPAHGVMTPHLCRAAASVRLLEGSARFAEILRARFPRLQVTHALIERFAPGQVFDHVVMGHVLEHVLDPQDVVRRATTWLRPGGLILASVPNARSLHRQAAVAMGMLANESSPSDSDVLQGHRRVFRPEEFRALFTDCGLSIEAFGGYWLKPVSDRQIMACWDGPMVDAFMALGERYPDIAAETYVIARLGR
jgi:2-polyprenyl-3-methyl-5-hydroxy-6-metoxy-1,4-benzoquinol methylase